MFDFVRKYTKILMFIMFLLIIPAFVLVGVNDFGNFGGSGPTVATVAGHSIKQEEWDAAHKAEVDRLRASMPNIDPKLLDSAVARYMTLEKMVRERVLAEAAKDLHLTTTDARLARELQQDPTIASLRKPDGSIDMQRYRELAAAQGLTPEGFEARVRASLTSRQIDGAVLDTSVTGKAQAKVALDAFFERREIQVALFSPKDYAGKVQPSDAEIESFYQANTVMFQAPESADIEYLVLDLDGVKKTIAINEADVKTYYEQNATRLSGKEERRASHILIAAAKDLPADQRASAKARAQALLEQVRTAPDSFAEVARKDSQDPGSAANGGDLDFFARGAMVKPFEDAAFAMKKGEISDLVESDFGYHIIKLTDAKIPKAKSLEELRAGIEADLRSQQAQRKFAEVAEVFTNGVYEQSDALQPIAEKLKLELKTASGLQRNAPAGANGILANPKLLAAVFSADSLDKKRNTEAIEIGASQLAAARVIQYRPAKLMPLPEVRADVLQKLVASRALALAKADGAEKLTAWRAKPDAAQVMAPVLVSRDQSQNTDPAIVAAALRAEASTLPTLTSVDLGNAGYAVVRVNKVLPRIAPVDAQAQQEFAQYGQWIASAESQAYYALLKAKYKVQIQVEKPSPEKAPT